MTPRAARTDTDPDAKAQAKRDRELSAQAVAALDRLETGTHRITVGDVEVRLSNVDKVMYPAAGMTKLGVARYYASIAPVLLPHLRGRPLTLKRYPDGVEGEFFYQKRCPKHRPDWVRTATVYSEGNGRDVFYCLASDVPSLLWAANLADLELHVVLSRERDLERPLVLAFDLDPGAPADIVDCCRVALDVHEVFEGLGMRSFPKTSGSKGMQVYVPLNPPAGEGPTFDDTKTVARALAELLARRSPDRVVSRMTKSLRRGKVLVDWSQNDAHKTTVAPYSLRAKEQPTVSTPLRWEEVEHALEEGDPELLRFTCDEVLERVEEHGDLYGPVLELRQELPELGT